MNLPLKLAHFNLYRFIFSSTGANDRRNWKRIYIARQLHAASNLSRRSHSLTETGHTFTKRYPGGSIETPLQKPTSTQHGSNPSQKQICADGASTISSL
jgi:hypothetical protein